MEKIDNPAWEAAREALAAWEQLAEEALAAQAEAQEALAAWEKAGAAGEKEENNRGKSTS